MDFLSIDELKSNLTLRRKFRTEYGIDEDNINNIFNKTKLKLKNKLDDSDSNYSKDLALITKKLNDIKGLFIPSGLLKMFIEIYTHMMAKLLKNLMIDYPKIEK